MPLPRVVFLIAGAFLLTSSAFPQGMAHPHLHPETNIRKPIPADAPQVRYLDYAAQAGLHFRHTSGDPMRKNYLLESTGAGVAVIDYDNDGLPDLFFVNGSRWSFSSAERPTSHLYRNLGNLKFQDVTKSAGFHYTGWGQGVCAGDYDNDGWTDILVTYYGHNILYHNDGNGHFTDITGKAGLPITGQRWGTGCSFVDYDRDGHLDITVANYLDFDPKTSPKPGEAAYCLFKGLPVACGPHGMKGSMNLLYRNQGDGTFRDVTHASGFDTPKGYTCFTVLPSDYDGDGWPDIFIACDSTPSILFHNNRDGTFTDAGVPSGTAFNADGEEQGSMGADAADLRHLGRPDLVKTNFDDDIPTYYRNEGNGFFTDSTYLAGLAGHRHYVGWGAGFFDFDNDGWADLMMTNGHVYPTVDRLGRESQFKQPKQLYWNSRDGNFADLSEISGPGITTPGTGRGLAYADLDNDGSLEVAINNLDAPPTLLVNQIKYNSNWITLKLTGVRSNRSAIGASVTLTAGSLKQTAEVRSGCCYLSQSDLRLHFGLGAASRIDLLEVLWPNGTVERFPAPGLNRVVEIKEGSGLHDQNQQ